MPSLAQCCSAWLSVSLGAQCCSAAMQKSLRIRKIGKNPVKRRIDLFQQFRLEKLEKQYSTLNDIMLALDLLWISDESVVVLLVLLSLR